MLSFSTLFLASQEGSEEDTFYARQFKTYNQRVIKWLQKVCSEHPVGFPYLNDDSPSIHTAPRPLSDDLGLA